MSEDSSSDDEWCASTKRKCWECGRKFSHIKSLMSHYKSHNIKATCHICNVTFRRLTSLSSHLDNAHSPPFCKKCHQSFSNVWELNKHAETCCIGSVQKSPSLIPAVVNQSQNGDNFSIQETAQQSTNCELRPPQKIEMKPETSQNSVEYIVGEDEDFNKESDFEKEDDSTSSESDDETSSKAGDGGSNSDSTDYSSDSSHNTHSKNSNAVRPSANGSMCSACGRGPFRSMKLHMRYCSGVKVKYQCSRCKELFLTESTLNEHYMPLYTCDVCGQVFPLENLYQDHQCPKGSKSPLVLFCSESMPQACNICKSFFTSENTLLNHVTNVHMSVVSTKVCIITNPSALAKKNASQAVHGTAAQPAIIGPNLANRVINGKLCVGQTCAGSLSTVAKSSAPPLSTDSSHPGRPSAPVCLTSAAPSARSGKDGALGQPTGEPLNCLSSPSTAVSDPVSAPVPTIMAMFENGSHDVALMKRMNTGWRSKAPYPCRQCGAVFRQPSLIISHRYLHRGRRSHQCQCGRAFKHRLHLLRHCVQHAETVSYICVSCGETFTGAKLLAKHIKGKLGKKPRPGHKWKHKVKRECRMPFTCDCGQLFFRPSAYIWHQLRNRTKIKRLTMPQHI